MQAGGELDISLWRRFCCEAMRDLANPATLKSSVLAAAATALGCCPRLLSWTTRPYALWYMEATIFLGTIVLWAFVFAWHTRYSQHPVIAVRLPLMTLTTATLAGVFIAIALHLFLDPVLRQRTPLDYPANFGQWVAITLFALGFSELFLVFAPYAWLMRLLRNRTAAAVLTVSFGVLVLTIKISHSTQPMPALLFGGLLLVRILLGTLTLYCYLRGGLLLAWWFGLLIEARHLLSLG